MIEKEHFDKVQRIIPYGDKLNLNVDLRNRADEFR